MGACNLCCADYRLSTLYIVQVQVGKQTTKNTKKTESHAHHE